MNKLIAATAAVTLLVSANAFAKQAKGQGGSGSSQQQQGQMGSTGSSGSMGGNQPQAQQHLTGRVLKASRDNITIDYNGAAVPFDVTRQTQFQGVTSARDLQEGQEVRASFDVKNNKNELRSLSIVGGAQGSQGTRGGASGSMGGGSMGGGSTGSQGGGQPGY